ncbi:alkene reductase [Rhizobium sp. BK251]|uniref:alkene reductase n=1 Tax=Rhizobium sp. BK251 TaxID=2512125 RepID=UPI00104E96EE|nr:alkene reductase [Rhizobium sp. BK251]TCL75707.1 2,4-dienoyl-CoA reductase-like NADH-dependent reductase (Old Yellow Enzyme family) [Rhizobium sp. BK251]
MKSLFETYDMSGQKLRNRVVMAPMTRARAKDGIADEQTAEYYRQRAGAGLIVTEGTPISQEGTGFAFIPGIWSDDQVRGWQGVTKAVHEEGGKIFAQIWHVGRMSHTSLQAAGGQPVSSSAKPARDDKSTAYAFNDEGVAGFVEASVPRPLRTDEVARVVNDFANAAANAVGAGFDGVEIHGANGYLLEQFLNPLINDRTDRYGAGSVEDRTRFVLEIVDAVVARIGAAKVGIRLSPFGRLFDMPHHPLIEETYLHLAAALAERNLAYVHLKDQGAASAPAISRDFLGRFRQSYSGTLILAGSLDKRRAEEFLRDGLIDLAAFGQPFIANPDLVARLRQDLALATPIRETYYGGGAAGYTDYPAYEDSAEAKAA